MLGATHDVEETLISTRKQQIPPHLTRTCLQIEPEMPRARLFWPTKNSTINLYPSQFLRSSAKNMLTKLKVYQKSGLKHTRLLVFTYLWIAFKGDPTIILLFRHVFSIK